MAVKSITRKENTNAAVALSNAYRNVYGVEASSYKAWEWAVMAASHGSAVAYGIFSKVYLNEVIVEKISSKLECRQCLEIAAKMGCITTRQTLETIPANEGDDPAEISHMEIAASGGSKVALTKCFTECKMGGCVTKPRLDEILEHYNNNTKGR